MSIFTDLIEAVDKGKKFKVDLINKSLWINRTQIIKEGVIVNEKNKSKDLIEEYDLEDYFGDYILLNKEPWKVIALLYKAYKYSIPSENSNTRSYFKALSVDELNDSDLFYNGTRNLMQAILEGYILLGSLKGWIKWKYDNHWFWQSEDKDLIVLRNWIE